MPQSNEPKTADQGASSRAIVVVADRDHLTRWSVQSYLEQWFEVRTASTLAEARSLVDTLSPMALVVGEEMPDGPTDGFVRKLREARPGMTVVAMVVPLEICCRRVDEGAWMLEKPFPLESLGRLLGVADPRRNPE